MRGEILAKKMHKLLKERMPNADLRVKRREGTISLGWSPVVRITIVSADEQKIEWNLGKIAEMDVDRKEVEEAFAREAVGPTEEIQWG